MTDATADRTWSETEDTMSRPRAPLGSGCVLMGDIVSHRAGVPEHLIQWRRRMGEDDPEPWL